MPASNGVDNEKTTKPNATGIPLPRTDSFLDEEHVRLTWRSWVVVFITCFAIFSQVFVVTAAGSVIAFIIRDLGEPELAGLSCTSNGYTVRLTPR